MNVCENVGAMPFQAYQTYLEKIRTLRPKLHEYLEDAGFVINDEKAYAKSVTKGYFYEAQDRESWEGVAKKFKYMHLNKIDTFCSELVSLSDSVVQDGAVLFCGCGNGDLIEWIRRNTVADVIGLDYSRGMLKEYHKRTSEPDSILARCENIPMRNESVKQIILSGIESQNIMTLLDEGDRVLIPGGEIRIASIRCTDEFFPYHKENFLDALRKAKYDEFMKNYVEKIYGTRESEEDLKFVMENWDCTSPHVQSVLIHMMTKGFDANYEFSRFPLVPRGYHLQNQGLQIPYAVVGKKPKD